MNTDLAILAAPGTSYRESPHWSDRGLCVTHDPALFDADNHATERAAKAICRAGAHDGSPCPVLTACLADALTTDAGGVRGGMSEEERRQTFRLGRRSA